VAGSGQKRAILEAVLNQLRTDFQAAEAGIPNAKARQQFKSIRDFGN
jgi:hypothetical protein